MTLKTLKTLMARMMRMMFMTLKVYTQATLQPLSPCYSILLEFCYALHCYGFATVHRLHEIYKSLYVIKSSISNFLLFQQKQHRYTDNCIFSAVYWTVLAGKRERRDFACSIDLIIKAAKPVKLTLVPGGQKLKTVIFW